MYPSITLNTRPFIQIMPECRNAGMWKCYTIPIDHPSDVETRFINPSLINKSVPYGVGTRFISPS